MILLKEIKFEKKKFVYETEDEYIQHSREMIAEGWMYNPFFSVYEKEIKQHCIYEKEIKE